MRRRVLKAPRGCELPQLGNKPSSRGTLPNDGRPALAILETSWLPAVSRLPHERANGENVRVAESLCPC